MQGRFKNPFNNIFASFLAANGEITFLKFLLIMFSMIKIEGYLFLEGKFIKGRFIEKLIRSLARIIHIHTIFIETPFENASLLVLALGTEHCFR